jgi:hypothetical protein
VTDQRPFTIANPLKDWTEEIGPVLWWAFPVVEPPYVGTPLDIGKDILVQVRTDLSQKEHQLQHMRVSIGGWPGYHTHWTPLPPVPTHSSGGRTLGAP